MKDANVDEVIYDEYAAELYGVMVALTDRAANGF